MEQGCYQCKLPYRIGGVQLSASHSPCNQTAFGEDLFRSAMVFLTGELRHKLPANLSTRLDVEYNREKAKNVGLTLATWATKRNQFDVPFWFEVLEVVLDGMVEGTQ